MTPILLVLQLATARPSPEEAVRVLLASHSELNRTGVVSLEDLPPTVTWSFAPAVQPAASEPSVVIYNVNEQLPPYWPHASFNGSWHHHDRSDVRPHVV